MKKRKKTKSRGNGEGSIYQLPNGKWRAAVTVGVSTGGKSKRKTKTCATRKLASNWLKRLLAENDVPAELLMSSDETVGEFLQFWLTVHVDKNLKKTTASDYRLSIQKRIIPAIGHMKLVKLNSDSVEHFLNQLVDDGVGGRAVQKCLSCMKSAMSFAVKRKKIQSNPCLGVAMPSYESKEIRPFTADEVRSLLKAVECDRLSGLFRLAFSLGLRQGEIFGLHWDDIDFKNETLSVRRSVQIVETELVIADPKTKSSKRTLELPGSCVVALNERRKIALAEGHAASEIVFPSPKGKYQIRQNFNRRVWKPLLCSLRLEHRGFHHTRHTYASLTLGEGVPLHIVSSVLGHSSPAITLSLYAHMVAGQQEQSRNAVDKLFGNG